MYECHNCGMLPFACVCVPWCHEHNRLNDPPCHECAVEQRRKSEREADLKSFSDPWHVRIIKLLTGG